MALATPSLLAALGCCELAHQPGGSEPWRGVTFCGALTSHLPLEVAPHLGDLLSVLLQRPKQVSYQVTDRQRQPPRAGPALAATESPALWARLWA